MIGSRAPLAFVVIATLLLPSTESFSNPLLVRETDPLTPQQERAALTVPDGFELQLFASEPMINKPINLAFDERGRLWVSSTVEYPYAAKKERWIDPQGSRVRNSRDAIKILEDTDRDGTADKVTDFADGLNIPTGVLPWHKPEHKDGCIAWSIPNIWYFADTTGDGAADHREVLFGPLGWEKDTHGMCSSFRMGPDGWVYATHGFNNTSHFKARDGSTLDLNSGNVFRFRPDGSRIEIWSWGQVNPFGLCFDRRGNLYSADCHSAPVYQLLHGAVYPSFGKPHHGLGFGPAMIEHTHGSTGICGIVYLDRDLWGSAWNDHLLIGNPVTSRINHDRIEFTGSTPRAIEQPDFVTSKDPWFRPVDLCLGGDGALYVADFYNRIIGHYEVPLTHPGRDRERGRIWRIVKSSGAAPVKHPPVITPRTYTVADLKSESPFVRRAAAAQFQFSPQLDAIEPLLQLLETTSKADTHLRHVARMALRTNLELPGAIGGLKPDPKFTELVLAVPSEEAAAHLLKTLKSSPPLAPPAHRNALTHIARYGTPASLNAAIELERERSGIAPVAQAGLIEAIAQGLAERGEVLPSASLLAWAHALAPTILDGDDDNSWTPSPHPDAPAGPVPWTLQSRPCADGEEVTVLSSLLGAGAKHEQLTGILRSKPFPAPKQLSFWIGGHRGFPDQPAHEHNYVRLVHADSNQELLRAYPPRNDTLQRVDWDLAKFKGQPLHLEIVDGDRGDAYAWLALTRIEPAILDITSFKQSDARTKALRTLSSLLVVTAPVDLRDRLRPYLPAAPAPAPIAISKEERARLDQLIHDRSFSFAAATPDPKNGHLVFETHCATCHQVAGVGGLLGPQLDGIGARGVARLCEDILDPNRNVDAHFYLTSLDLKDNTSTAGFVRAESGAVLLLVDATGAEHRVPKSSIAKTTTTALSLMPPSFGETLKESELHDLVAWLLAQ